MNDSSNKGTLNDIPPGKLVRFFTDGKSGTLAHYFDPDDHQLREKIMFYVSPRLFRVVWGMVYRDNAENIDAFIKGDYSQLGSIDFNNLVMLFEHAYPAVDHDLYYKGDPSDLTLQDYINIANRLWAINIYRH
jgi:hypothetical protein